jgi:predicted 2-oxoglutarate/Fe(II)-dependent dioxygenase YbiX
MYTYTAAAGGVLSFSPFRARSRMNNITEEVLDANAAQRRYWNTVALPRSVAAPGFREQRNQESTAYCWRVWA